MNIYKNAGLLKLTYTLFAVFALMSTGLVVALAERAAVQRAVVRWVSVLALIGTAVMAVNFWYLQDALPEMAARYASEKADYEGFGLWLYGDADGNVWIAPIAGGPAEEMGIRTGDQLLEVNGKATQGKSVVMVNDLLAGGPESGTTMLRVQSPGSEPREVTIARGSIQLWLREAQEAISMVSVRPLDPSYLFGFGLLGLWMLVVNFIQRGDPAFPALLNWLGMAAGGFYWLFVAGSLLFSNVLLLVASVAGLILAPAWFVWMGIRLGKIGKMKELSAG